MNTEFRDRLDRAIAEARASGDLTPLNRCVFVENDDGRTAVFPICPACWKEPGYEDGGLCSRCEDDRRWRELCPSIYRQHASIEQLTEGVEPWTEEEASVVRSFVEGSEARTLGLISIPGRGKTTAGFGVIRALLDADHHSVVFTTATRMLKDLTVRQFEPDAQARYTKPDILFLDELGDRDERGQVQPLTGFQRQQLQDVLWERNQDEMKLLIWTSNVLLEDLRNWCHERTWERLWDKAVILQIGGKSRRQLAAA